MPTPYSPGGGNANPAPAILRDKRRRGSAAGCRHRRRTGVGADGTAVVQVAQDQQRLLYEVVTAFAADIGNEADAAGVVLLAARVKAAAFGGAARLVDLIGADKFRERSGSATAAGNCVGFFISTPAAKAGNTRKCAGMHAPTMRGGSEHPLRCQCTATHKHAQ